MTNEQKVRILDEAKEVMKTEIGVANATLEIYNRSQIGWQPYSGCNYNPRPTTDPRLSVTVNELMSASDVFAENRLYNRAIHLARVAGNNERVNALRLEARAFFEERKDYFTATEYAHDLGDKEDAARLNLLALERWAHEGIRKGSHNDYRDLRNLLGAICGEHIHSVRRIPPYMLAERRTDLYTMVVDALTTQGELKAAAEVAKQQLGDNTRARALYKQFRETSAEREKLLNEAKEEALFAENLEDHEKAIELYERAGAREEAERFVSGALWRAKEGTPIQDYMIRKLCELTHNPVTIAQTAVKYNRREFLEEMIAKIMKGDETHYDTSFLVTASDVIGERYSDLAHQLASITIDLCIAENSNFSAAVVGMKTAYCAAKRHCPERLQEVRDLTRVYAERTASWVYLCGEERPDRSFSIAWAEILPVTDKEARFFKEFSRKVSGA